MNPYFQSTKRWRFGPMLFVVVGVLWFSGASPESASAKSKKQTPNCTKAQIKQRARVKKQIKRHAQKARRYGATRSKAGTYLTRGVKVLPRCLKYPAGCRRAARRQLARLKAKRLELRLLRKVCLSRRQRIRRLIAKKGILAKLIGIKSGTISAKGFGARRPFGHAFRSTKGVRRGTYGGRAGRGLARRPKGSARPGSADIGGGSLLVARRRKPRCTKANLVMRARTKKNMVRHARKARQYGAPMDKSMVRLLGGVKVLPRCRKPSPSCRRSAKVHRKYVKALQRLLRRLRRSCRVKKHQVRHKVAKKRGSLLGSNTGLKSLLGSGPKSGAFGARLKTRSGGFRGTKVGRTYGSGGLGFKGSGRGGGGSAYGIGLAGVGRGGGRGYARRRRYQRGTIKMVMNSITDTSLRRQVKLSMRRRRRAFLYCYERSLIRRRGLRGSIKVSFSINRRGRTNSTMIKRVIKGAPRVSSCVRRRLRIFRFPRSKRVLTVVVYTLHFSPRKP